MFTGIVEELGKVKGLKRKAQTSLLEIDSGSLCSDTRIGDSIAVNGVCLTVVHKGGNILSFDVMPETMEKSNLKDLRLADKVNLERSLKVGDRLSGHFVTGHIDSLGFIRERRQLKGNLSFEIEVDAGFMPLLASKCSVCVDGISLTVVQKMSRSFTVYVIPHTLKSTTLDFKGRSSRVNVEFDILAKYLLGR